MGGIFWKVKPGTSQMCPQCQSQHKKELTNGFTIVSTAAIEQIETLQPPAVMQRDSEAVGHNSVNVWRGVKQWLPIDSSNPRALAVGISKSAVAHLQPGDRRDQFIWADWFSHMHLEACCHCSIAKSSCSSISCEWATQEFSLWLAIAPGLLNQL